ncbi:MAG: GNAT family N-acetyltransferase, partial [Bacillota bacterium]
LQKFNMTHQAFHPEEGIFTRLPSYIKKMTQAPMYDPDLDLVIQDQAGELAAACTIWFDQENNIGMFEPVATHPAYQRQGLGRALLMAGLIKLKNRGAERAYVEAYGEKRYAFYVSAGFAAYDRDYPWTKLFKN